MGINVLHICNIRYAENGCFQGKMSWHAYCKYIAVNEKMRNYKEAIMAKIVPEKAGSLTEVKKGSDVTELKFKMSIHGEDMHYPGEMISGCKLMEKCIDACTELSNIRDNGDGGLFVHTEGNILHPVHMLDCVEIIVWLIKQGTSSRVYGYEMYKTSEYDIKTDRSTVFDEPILTVKGDVVFVLPELRKNA